MIPVKMEEEIEIMRNGGRILAWVMDQVTKQVRPGESTFELDKFAEKLIKKKGGFSSFKRVPRYHWATCMCVNDCVVHGIPNQYRLKEGDVLGVDIGVFYQGFHTDMARTLRVRAKNLIFKQSEEGSDESRVKLKTKNDKAERFLETGRLALEKAIGQTRVGNRVGHISKAIQDTVEEAGYSVVKTLVGHGVGRELHEEPQIPCFLRAEIESTPLLRKGMTIAIEVIYNLGTDEIVLKKSDGWTILTKDGKLSGLFEDTIAITENGPIILTKSV